MAISYDDIKGITGEYYPLSYNSVKCDKCNSTGYIEVYKGKPVYKHIKEPCSICNSDIRSKIINGLRERLYG